MNASYFFPGWKLTKYVIHINVGSKTKWKTVLVIVVVV